MPVNDVTTNRSYQKPNIANTLADDVGRLRSALDAIDADMASKAPTAGPTFTGVTTVAAGSAGAPSLTFTGATSDTGLYSPGADQLALSTAGTGRLFVDASGSVQLTSVSPYNLGTTPPQLYLLNSSASRLYNLSASTELAVERATTCYMSIIGGSSSILQFGDADAENPGRLTYDHGNDSLSVFTAGTERARIDSSGRLLVGTSTARGNFSGTGGSSTLQVEGTTPSTCVFSLTANQANSLAPWLVFAKTRGTTTGANTAANDNDHVGSVSFQAADGTNLIEAARIRAELDGATGANDMPGRLVFSTTADGAAAPTEAMRITSSKYLRLAAGTGGIQFNGDTAAANALNDYEEGTWTPAYQLLTTNFDAVNYNAGTLGRYTKIGKAVIAHCLIVVQDFTLGSGTGNLAISGLPFTVENVATNPTGPAVCTGAGWTNYPFAVRAIANTTRMDIYVRSTANGTAVNATQVDLPAATGGGNRLILSASISYRAT